MQKMLNKRMISECFKLVIIFIFSVDVSFSQVVDGTKYEPAIGKQAISVDSYDELVSTSSLLNIGTSVSMKNFYVDRIGGSGEYAVQSSAPIGMINDTISVLKVSSNKYLVKQIRSIVDIREFGGIIGVLGSEYPDSTIASLNSMRVANKQAFLKACAFAMQANATVFIPGNYELWLPDSSDDIDITNSQTLRIHGVDKIASKLDFYPKVHRRSFTYDAGSSLAWSVFYLTNYGSLEIKNLSCVHLADEVRNLAQTYPATLKFGADANTIKIWDSEILWSKIWDNLEVGDVLFYDFDTLRAGNYTTIASIDSNARTITTVDAIAASNSGSIANDDSTAYTKIAFQWDFDIELDQDTIVTYSETWQDTRSASSFIIARGSMGSDLTNRGLISIQNSDVINFTNVSSVSSVPRKFEVHNSKIQGIEVAMGGGAINDGRGVFLVHDYDYLELTKCGQFTENETGEGSASGGVSSERIWGSGIYNGPNTVMHMRNSYVHDNRGLGVRNFSDSGASSKSADESIFNYFYNTTFQNNDEGSLLTSRYVPTKIETCKFLSGEYVSSLLLNNTTFIADSYIDVSTIISSTNEPPANDSIGYTLGIDRVQFGKNAQVSIGQWDASEMNRLSVSITNSEVLIDTVASNSSSSSFLNLEQPSDGLASESTIVDVDKLTIRFPLVDDPGQYEIRKFANWDTFNGKLYLRNVKPFREGLVFKTSAFASNYLSERSSRYPTDRRINIEDSDVSAWSYFDFNSVRTAVKGSIRLSNSKVGGTVNLRGYSQYTNLLGNAEKLVTIKDTILFHSVSSQEDLAFAINLEDTYGRYFTLGDTLQSVSYLKQASTSDQYNGLRNIQATIELCPTEDLTVIGQSDNPRSNIVGSTRVLEAGRCYSTIVDGLHNFGSRGAKRDTIALNPGDSLYNSDYIGNGTQYVVPGSMSFSTTSGLNGYFSLYGAYKDDSLKAYLHTYDSYEYQFEFENPRLPGDSIYIEYDTVGLDWLEGKVDILDHPALYLNGVANTTAGPATTLTITHNLGQAPTYISITPGGDIGDWYVNTVNSTTMTLNYTSTATTSASNVNIYWQVE